MSLLNELKRRFKLQQEYLGGNKSVNKIVPLVSVVVNTYQHVNYIGECLEGILAQRIDFPMEIVIGDDGSTDGTQEICMEYAKKYPDKIRLFLRNRDLSHYHDLNDKSTIRFNGHWTRMSARGKYIAMCEGDDYWIDNFKLQKQVAFLEKNTDYAITFHSVRILQKNKLMDDNITFRVSSTTNIYDLAKGGNFIHTPSCLYLKNWITPPEWLLKCPIGDYPLHMINAQHGKIKFFDEYMAVYRIHQSNNWAGKGHEFKALKSLECIKLMLGNFEPKVNLILEEAFIKGSFHLFKVYLKLKEFKKAFACIFVLKNKFRLMQILQGFFSYLYSSTAFYIKKLVLKIQKLVLHSLRL
jgi:glycosyltransferase involved in cell wall biosynthesis